MAWHWTPYAIPLLLAAAICLLVAWLGWRSRGPGRKAFVVLLVSVAVWAAAYALEISSGPLEQKILWSKIEYLGIVIAPVAWLVFALQYSDKVARPGWAMLAGLLAIPVTTLVVLWTPGGEAWIWPHVSLAEGPAFDLLENTYGPWFWVHTAYSYVLWAIAAATLLRALGRSPLLYRKQAVAVIVAVVSPLVLNVIYVSGWAPLDLTPFGFAITGLATFWSLVRQRFLDVMPIARARVIEGIRDGVVVLDAEDRVVDLNPAAEEIIGNLGSTVLGRSFNDAFSGRIELHELTELRSWPLFDRSENPRGRVIVFRDISGQKQAEDALRSSEEQLRVVIEQMPAVLWTTDSELRFTQMLGAGLQQLRVPPNAAAGMDIFEFFGTIDNTHPAIAGHMKALDGMPAAYSVEWFGRDFECHVEPLMGAQGVPSGIIGVGLDVTEHQDLQDQLRQSQKMEAIGRMAGGVAHDFNNLLTAVAGYAQLAQEDLEAIDSQPRALENLRRDLDAIGHAAERAASITAQLLAFSRRQVLQPRVLQLNETIEDMNKMLLRLIGGHVELVTFLDPDADPVKADPVQIQQVVINLVLNARDALPQGGKITVETMNLELTESHPVRYDVIDPGSYVVLAVSDDGFGMDERTQAHIFEPFHDQGRRQRDRLGALDGLRDRPADRRFRRGEQQGRRRNDLQSVFSQGRRRGRRDGRGSGGDPVPSPEGIRVHTAGRRRRDGAGPRDPSSQRTWIPCPGGRERRRGSRGLPTARRTDRPAGYGCRDAGDERPRTCRPPRYPDPRRRGSLHFRLHRRRLGGARRAARWHELPPKTLLSPSPDAKGARSLGRTQMRRATFSA